MNPPSDALLQVLVIDDDEQHLKFMTRALAQDDVVITTIRDPRKAVELVQSQRPQLVLVDLVMPGVSGMEVLENIVSLDPTIEVVLLTGHYSTDSAVEAIQKGASDYLTKPVPIQKLKERVDSMLAELRGHQRRLQLDNELVVRSLRGRSLNQRGR